MIYNYRKLKIHCEEIPDEIGELGDTTFDEQRLSLETLMAEKAKTYKIMRYVDSILEAYRVYVKDEGDLDERRYKVLDRLYINKQGLKASDLEELFNISNKQVYRDRNQALDDLSVLLFGASIIDFK